MLQEVAAEDLFEIGIISKLDIWKSKITGKSMCFCAF